MNLAELREEVKLVIADPGYTDIQIDDYINQAYRKATDMVAIPQLKTLLSLETVVDQRYLTLSADASRFSGRLNKLMNGTSTVEMFPDLEAFIESFPESETGSVLYACLEGNVLWYHPVPEEVMTLVAIAYLNPVTLVDDSDIPVYLPDSLHRKLLVSGACWMIFDTIEDGIEGEKVNTISHFYHSFHDSHRSAIKSGVKELQEFIGARRCHFQSSVWKY